MNCHSVQSQLAVFPGSWKWPANAANRFHYLALFIPFTSSARLITVLKVFVKRSRGGENLSVSYICVAILKLSVETYTISQHATNLTHFFVSSNFLSAFIDVRGATQSYIIQFNC